MPFAPAGGGLNETALVARTVRDPRSSFGSGQGLHQEGLTTNWRTCVTRSPDTEKRSV